MNHFQHFSFFVGRLCMARGFCFSLPFILYCGGNGFYWCWRSSLTMTMLLFVVVFQVFFISPHIVWLRNDFVFYRCVRLHLIFKRILSRLFVIFFTHANNVDSPILLYARPRTERQIHGDEMKVLRRRAVGADGRWIMRWLYLAT